jgi:hypothetical protein
MEIHATFAHVALLALILLQTTPRISPPKCTTFEDIFLCLFQRLDEGWSG